MATPTLTLNEIATWNDSGCQQNLPKRRLMLYTPNQIINKKISLISRGDTTNLHVDAIVNRTERSFSSGGTLFRKIQLMAGQ